jgi:acetyl esterase
MEAIAERFPAPADRIARRDHWVALPEREILVRVYRPAPGTLPVLVYFHGGGWIAGSVSTHDGACAALADDAQIVVASVHYRRPPENPFPAPNDDAYAACEWVAVNAKMLDIDPTRLAVGGDSAGAHLAASVTLEARERRRPAIAFQLLVYPVIAPDFETASYLRNAVTPSLTRADMIEYWRHYLRDLATRDPRAVPLRAATHAGLPRAHVVVAALDPLRDEGARYAEVLTQAGVATTCVETPTLTHGFVRAAPFVAAAREAQRAFGRATGTAFV